MLICTFSCTDEYKWTIFSLVQISGDIKVSFSFFLFFFSFVQFIDNKLLLIVWLLLCALHIQFSVVEHFAFVIESYYFAVGLLSRTEFRS